MAVRLAAPAKLNLFLHITGKRDDGYHLLESLVAFGEYGDILEIEPAESVTLDITGPFAAALATEDNIVMRAAQLFKARSRHGGGAHITLEKRLPVGAGLGGGSADAAAALSGLGKLWSITLTDSKWQEIALQLGSDVPVCMTGQAAWMQGIGEKITTVNLNTGAWAVLVNPGMPLLTADVFHRFSGVFAPPEEIPESMDSFDALIRCLQPKRNMLETPAAALMPVINDVLEAIKATPGCHLSRMSGSGATCFGLYGNAASAKQAAQHIKTRHPAWWSVAARLR